MPAKSRAIRRQPGCQMSSSGDHRDPKPECTMISFASVRATPNERRRPLPGDALIPGAAATVMHAITISTTSERIWPWLVQMGAGRAGWHSYDWVDNDGHPSATEIIPSLQHVALGDVMPSLRGERRSFIVHAVEPARDLVLAVPAAAGGFMVTWEFFLEPFAPRRTRLLVRGRVSALRGQHHRLGLASSNGSMHCWRRCLDG
jgi:hypothetical protein